jgi:uncharacterized protein (TIGR02466 family)
MKIFYQPFASDIYYNSEAQVSNHDELKKWVLDMYAQSPAKESGNFYHTGFTTYFYDDFTAHLDTIDVFKELRDTIIQEAEKYVEKRFNHLDQYGTSIPKMPKALRITNLWFNVNPPGGYQGKHHHANTLLGGTYYLDVPKESGKIGFYDPNQFAYLHNQEPPAMNLLIPNFDVITKAGDLLIWPGWMDHEISVNKTTDQNRITLSFGINWV